jgi:signal transduction histidine kinase
MAFAIAVTICAAGLILILQHRALSAQQAQTQVILRQVSEQAAADIAAEVRRTLDGPVFDTLTAVNHPDLRAGRLDLVATQFAAGLAEYPHVDRFFAWTAQTELRSPGEVVFHGRDGAGFVRDPVLGRAVLDLARRHAAAQQIYIAAEGVVPGRSQQVFLRLFWTDARRVDYFAVLGFVVDPARLRMELFNPERSSLRSVLTRRAGGLPLQLTVTDEAGARVYGDATGGLYTSRVSFPMLFYPADEIHSRLAAGVSPRQWAIQISLPPSGGVWQAFEGYGPTALSVLLLLVSLALTIQAHRRSAELARMQSDFVAHVSHQLKTPLSLLSAATETLEMDRVRSPDRFAEYLRTIHAEAARLSQLVQRVLEFSRMQQRRDYEFESADLAALVRETVAAFADGLSARGFAFDVRVDGPSPLVRADPAALEQVLINLLDNAVKYSGAERDIAVRVYTNRGSAIVDIIDRGMGIAPREQKRIFERFYRAPGPGRPGFGLGLPIVKELIDAHGGGVDVDSVPGGGSTFRVRLPLDTVPLPVLAPAEKRRAS